MPILAGSDAPNPGTSHGAALHRELEMLVEAGLSPTDATRDIVRIWKGGVPFERPPAPAQAKP